jgi:hypothetical protein
MKPANVETLVWVLIYGGLLLGVLGLAVQPLEGALGWSLVGLGAVMAAVGVVLIWVRSRMDR